MTCVRCGRASAEGASFCWNCGSPLRANAAVPVTPEPEPASEGAVIVPAAPWPKAAAASGRAPSPWLVSEEPESGPWNEPEGPEPPPSPWLEGAAEAPSEPWAPGGSSPAIAHEPWTPPAGGGGAGPFTAAASHDAPALVPAGFWRRFWAALLDSMIVWSLSVPFMILWLLPHLAGAGAVDLWTDDEKMAWGTGVLLYWAVSSLLEVLYFSLFESSRHRATLGRIVFGMEVTTLKGERISFWRAFGRRLARALSGFLFGIGFFAMLFSDRRQTLHDLIAGTLVVRRRT
jgi:uncharacterized RDD family membrane protein YckC